MKTNFSKNKFTWNNLKDSHNNVWKLDKSLDGSNNLKKHGTKKLNNNGFVTSERYFNVYIS
jgi:hypothetical protein